MSASLVVILYLISAVLFIFALRGLSHPKSARLGNIFGIIGMVIAVVLASVNIFGGFIVTYRMLSMFKKKTKFKNDS